MRRHVTSSLYPTGHSAVRLCNVTGDMLRYDAFVTGVPRAWLVKVLPEVLVRSVQTNIDNQIRPGLDSMPFPLSR